MRLMILAPMLVLMPLGAPAQNPGGTGPVENVGFGISGGEVLIRYDLRAPANETFRVEVILRRTSDPPFSHVPSAVSGDIGEGVPGGTGKRVRWTLKTEFPAGLDGDDYYFVVSAAEEDGGIDALLWAAGAGAAVAGGAVLFMVLSRDDALPPAGGGYPSPPGRP